LEYRNFEIACGYQALEAKDALVSLKAYGTGDFTQLRLQGMFIDHQYATHGVTNLGAFSSFVPSTFDTLCNRP
jgi:hypothetical protein